VGERRFQVFISSTSVDLADERRVVIDALLEAGYIPVGMELFNAATEKVWPVIERLIDGCDYYIVIVAGRYGSVRPNGMSYTRSEYEYARRIGKPCLAFLHRRPERLPSHLVEPTATRYAKVQQFRRLLEEELLCKTWERGADELARKVVNSLNAAVVQTPQPGWVRGDSLEGIAAQVKRDLIDPARAAGIARISPDGQAGPVMSEHIAGSRSIAIMSTSAARVIEIQKSYLVDALANGCDVRLLVPELDSEFLRDVEEAESQDSYREPISDEIVKVRRRLREAVGEALRLVPAEAEKPAASRVRVGSFTTHLRSTMILCDDDWGWLTITLPPARAPQTPSFELGSQGPHTLLAACLRHFERTWSVVAERGKVEEVTVGRGAW
jgi:Domain of unknown function (DUF4062)